MGYSFFHTVRGMGLIMDQTNKLKNRQSYENKLYCKTHILEKSENFTHMFIGVKNQAFILTNAVNDLENCR